MNTSQYEIRFQLTNPDFCYSKNHGNVMHLDPQRQAIFGVYRTDFVSTENERNPLPLRFCAGVVPQSGSGDRSGMTCDSVNASLVLSSSPACGSPSAGGAGSQAEWHTNRHAVAYFSGTSGSGSLDDTDRSLEIRNRSTAGTAEPSIARTLTRHGARYNQAAGCWTLRDRFRDRKGRKGPVFRARWKHLWFPGRTVGISL